MVIQCNYETLDQSRDILQIPSIRHEILTLICGITTQVIRKEEYERNFSI